MYISAAAPKAAAIAKAGPITAIPPRARNAPLAADATAIAAVTASSIPFLAIFFTVNKPCVTNLLFIRF